VEGRLDGMRRKMALPSYEKTPEQVKAEDQDRLAKADAELSAALSAIKDFEQLLKN
jgi:valyl-tRNA synthetase